MAAASRKWCSYLFALGWALKEITLVKYPAKCTFRQPKRWWVFLPPLPLDVISIGISFRINKIMSGSL